MHAFSTNRKLQLNKTKIMGYSAPGQPGWMSTGCFPTRFVPCGLRNWVRALGMVRTYWGCRWWYAEGITDNADTGASSASFDPFPPHCSLLRQNFANNIKVFWMNATTRASFISKLNVHKQSQGPRSAGSPTSFGGSQCCNTIGTDADVNSEK